MGGRFLKGLAYLALFAVIALTSCQASFANGATGGATGGAAVATVVR